MKEYIFSLFFVIIVSLFIHFFINWSINIIWFEYIRTFFTVFILVFIGYNIGNEYGDLNT